MSVSVLALSLLVVAGLQSVDGRRLERRSISKEKWDALYKENEAFVKAHKEFHNALQLIDDMWTAVAKYECIVDGKDAAECKEMKDLNKVWDEDIKGQEPSAAEISKVVDESDADKKDTQEALAIEKAMLAYIVKKEPDNSKALLDFFNYEYEEFYDN